MGHPTVDLHSFFANTDLATFLIQIPIQLKKNCKNYHVKSFLE